jgi:hypothetical protein
MDGEHGNNRISAHSRGLVVICSHSVDDPLVSTLILDYTLRLQAVGGGRHVLLFTEEPLLSTDHRDLSARLASERITWIPLQYDHRQRFQWLRKFRNGLILLQRCRGFLKKHPNSAVLGFLGIAGAYALLMKEFLGFAKGITLCFEPHSLYMREVGIWSPWSPKYLFTSWMERLQIKRMDVLVVPTSSGHAQALAMGRKGPTPVLGVTIDVGACLHDPHMRAEIREKEGFGNDPVFLYVGKFGGIYHSVDEYVRFMCAVLKVIPDARFMIVTFKEWSDLLDKHPARAELGERLRMVPPVPPDELSAVLSAGDIGVVAIPPSPAQAFRTPVKTAHYWAAGMPILIPRGVSDDGSIAEQEGTGIVVDDLASAGDHELVRKMAEFRALDPEVLRQRCIGCAMRYRDTSRTVELLNELLA